MHLPKIRVTLLFLQLIASACVARVIIETSKSEESSNLMEAVVQILRSCYKPQLTTLGIAGNSSGIVIPRLFSEEPFSITLLDNTSRSMNSDPVTSLTQFKLQAFVIVASSATELNRILMDISISRWWNYMAQFYILPKERGCTRAYEILSSAWKRNLLEANFICIHETKVRMIYSFNPYTSNAPKPWQLVTTHSYENHRSWTLLVREYRKNEEICDNMNFDKTKNLGGYKISIVVEDTLDISAEVNNNLDVDHLSIEMIRGLSRTLNATVKLIRENEDDNKGRYHKSMINGIADIELIGRFYVSDTNLRRRTYPHIQIGLYIVTQYRGDKSQLKKIVSVLDVSSRICLCVVLLVTLIALKYIVRQSTPTAVLNVIRIICNGSITNLRHNAASRIYLSSLLLIVVTIQGIYQGQLASILAKRVPLENIETEHDLVESDYRIYTFKDYLQLFNDPAFEKLSVGIEEYECTDYVLRDSSAACLTSWSIAIGAAAQFKLHLSRDFVVNRFVSWRIQKDWPLEQRVNMIVQGLVETGNVGRWKEIGFQEAMRIIEANNNEDKDKTCKILTLADMSFAFVILGIGLGCATIIFIVELAIKRRARKRIVKLRRDNSI